MLDLKQKLLPEIKVSDDGVYKITPGCELLDTGRSLRLPRLKFVVLMALRPFTKKPMARRRSTQEAQIICSSAFPPIRPSRQPDDSSPRQHSPTLVGEILR